MLKCMYVTYIKIYLTKVNKTVLKRKLLFFIYQYFHKSSLKSSHRRISIFKQDQKRKFTFPPELSAENHRTTDHSKIRRKLLRHSPCLFKCETRNYKRENFRIISAIKKHRSGGIRKC